ncbi:hypothetical protein H5410_050408 [Solanum commersonii]|uniref:Isopenicillin N synthase-like Fe(2+) 2OG dioxygenase domain-containing protein n=1 Tax=Solanum commersonii TaxID=4109 RepID=A0A9J5WWZ6_SOLCO|nr:hypothetical protein H5410_050408 [Solanum commersonii]
MEMPNYEATSFSSIVKEIPVIDLGEDRTVVARQLVKALEEYGFFQDANRHVGRMCILVQFCVSLSAHLCTQSWRSAEAKLNGIYVKQDELELKYDIMMKQVTNHGVPEDLMDEAMEVEVISAYSTEVRMLSMIIFDLVSKGLGLEAGYFGKEHKQKMIVHHFLVCPDPSSTLGMDGHCDPNLITIYQQKVYGLQILKNEEWIGVEPLPHAFVFNFGLPIMVMTNGKLENVAHRVVPNTTQTCTGIGIYFSPANIVEPAKSFVGPDNPPLFKPFKWDTEFFPHYANKKLVYHAALEAFKIYA